MKAARKAAERRSEYERNTCRFGRSCLVMLMSLTLLTAQAESALPSEVADLFTVKAWAHYAIANQPDMPENKAFAVMQEESGYEAALLVICATPRAKRTCWCWRKNHPHRRIGKSPCATGARWSRATRTCRSWRRLRTGVSPSTTRTATARISRMKRMAGS